MMTDTQVHGVIHVRLDVPQTMLQYLELAIDVYQQAAVQSIAGDAAERAYYREQALIEEGKQVRRYRRVVERYPRSKRQFSALEIRQKRQHDYAEVRDREQGHVTKCVQTGKE